MYCKAAETTGRAALGDKESAEKLRRGAGKALAVTEKLIEAAAILSGPSLLDSPKDYDRLRQKQIEACISQKRWILRKNVLN